VNHVYQNENPIFVSMTSDVPSWQFDDEFDGGEETCGRVIVNLYLYIRDQEPGRRVLVISRDPGAPVELPAWCRMTRNQLTAKQHPYYLITLKPELIKE
jgi:TusA-related sulfurtransferase